MFWSNVNGRLNQLKSSIATRLTAWYCFVSFLFAVLAATTMYWLLATHLLDDDDTFLQGRIGEARTIIRERSDSDEMLLAEMHREAANAPGSQVRIISKNGQPFLETPIKGGSIFSEYSFNMPNVGENQAVTWRSPEGISYRMMWSYVDGPQTMKIEIALDRTQEQRLLDDYRNALISIISILFVAAAAGGVVIARRELRPLAKLSALVSEIKEEDLHQRLGTQHWPIEIQPLAQSFDRVLSRMEDAFSRVSTFSADIAHELRTPLHVLRGEAELVLTRLSSSNQDYRNCIESAAEEYARLTVLVDGLLFLAKTSQMDTPINSASVSLLSEVSAVCDFYQAMADEENVHINVNVSGFLTLDSALFRRALGNVIANAIRYTPPGGKIEIYSINKTELTKYHGLVISDTGIGIEPEELSRVFDRFYRSDQARSRTSDGTGLGLPIVKNIMALHQGEVIIESVMEKGTMVTLRFPVVSP